MFEFQFESLGDFLAMGGYASFVWLSYAAFFIAVVWNWWQPRQERKRIVRLLRARNDRQHPAQQYGGDAKQQSAQQQQHH